MSNNNQYYKVRIHGEIDSLLNDIIQFLSNKSTSFKREYLIDKLLKTNKIDVDFLINNSPIPLEDVFGSTYQSSYRNNNDIYAISHDIISIGLDSDGFYAMIQQAKNGEILDYTKGLLRPVWYKDSEEQFLLATFDIDFDISDDAA